MTSNTQILCDALLLLCLMVIIGSGSFMLFYTKVAIEWICQAVGWKEVLIRVCMALPPLFVGFLYLFLFCWTFISLRGEL